MKTFHLHRLVDSSGVSGTGIIAQGVEFDDGPVVLRWLTDTRSTSIFASLQDLLRVHSHGGGTTLVWDAPTTPRPDTGLRATLDERAAASGRPPLGSAR